MSIHINILKEISKGPKLKCPLTGLYVNQINMVHDNLGRLIHKKAFRLTRIGQTQLKMKGGLNVIETQEDDVWTTQREGNAGSQSWTWQ